MVKSTASAGELGNTGVRGVFATRGNSKRPAPAGPSRIRQPGLSGLNLPDPPRLSNLLTGRTSLHNPAPWLCKSLFKPFLDLHLTSSFRRLSSQPQSSSFRLRFCSLFLCTRVYAARLRKARLAFSSRRALPFFRLCEAA